MRAPNWRPGGTTADRSAGFAIYGARTTTRGRRLAWERASSCRSMPRSGSTNDDGANSAGFASLSPSYRQHLPTTSHLKRDEAWDPTPAFAHQRQAAQIGFAERKPTTRRMSRTNRDTVATVSGYCLPSISVQARNVHDDDVPRASTPPPRTMLSGDTHHHVPATRRCSAASVHRLVERGRNAHGSAMRLRFGPALSCQCSAGSHGVHPCRSLDPC